MSRKAPRLQYTRAVANISIRLTTRSRLALVTIQDLLRRESDDPTRPVSVSTAGRRAIEVYAAGLNQQAGRNTLHKETVRANANTYANKKKGSR